MVWTEKGCFLPHGKGVRATLVGRTAPFKFSGIHTPKYHPHPDPQSLALSGDGPWQR